MLRALVYILCFISEQNHPKIQMKPKYFIAQYVSCILCKMCGLTYQARKKNPRYGKTLKNKKKARQNYKGILTKGVKLNNFKYGKSASSWLLASKLIKITISKESCKIGKNGFKIQSYQDTAKGIVKLVYKNKHPRNGDIQFSNGHGYHFFKITC